MANILKNPRAYATASTLKEESTMSRTGKSHYRSFGPEFHQVLFNYGGQSPLILYYLKMHQRGGIFINPRQKGSKFTKIFKEPTPPAPTYADIIRDSKKIFARNKQDFRKTKQRIKEDIKFLKEQQEKIDKELDRLQAKASRNIQEVRNDFDIFLHKLRAEARLKEDYKGTLISSCSELPQLPESSSSSLAAAIEELNYLEEG